MEEASNNIWPLTSHNSYVTSMYMTYSVKHWIVNYLSEKKVITPSVWNHITVTYDSQIGTAVIYINGTESVRGKGSGLISRDWNKRIGIGRHKGVRFLDGDVDEFKIYDVPLEKEQVEELSNKCDFNKYCKYNCWLLVVVNLLSQDNIKSDITHKGGPNRLKQGLSAMHMRYIHCSRFEVLKFKD